MDIHRCRFVPYPASTINVLAFSHFQTGKGETIADLRLAIGRANGDIEIWNPLNGAWLQETILRGGKDRSVDGLVWIQDPDGQNASGRSCTGKLRLFSVGYTTTITEWDLERAQPLRQSSGNHGEIWCIAAQPSNSTASESSNIVTPEQWLGQNLITGCNDGAVVLYSTADEDLKLQRMLVRPSSKKAKVISIIFQDRHTVVAGCTDSTVRIYDIRTGALVRSMSLGVGPAGGPKEIIIWTIKCLPNGNIVSGDSTGEMRIWDGKTYTLIQRMKSHKQDILSLATSNDGSMIFSGGMDRRTVAYKQIGGSRTRWGEVAHRRFHSHDVKTMTSFEGMGMSIIVSGGPDGSPIVLPLKEFGMEYQRMLPCLPQEPPLQSATNKRLLMSWWDRAIYIWLINTIAQSRTESLDSDTESEKHRQSRKLVGKVILKGEANITSASITSDGNLLAVATSKEIKIFRIQSQNAGDSNALRIRKLNISPKFLSKGTRLLQFSPDGQWLGIVTLDNRVIAVRIVSDGKNSFQLEHTLSELGRLDRESDNHSLCSALGRYDRTITRIAFSSNSQILAVSDLAGFIDTWVFESPETFAVTTTDDKAANDASLPSSSDESNIEEEGKSTPSDILVQHWKRNPSASLLPKLSSTCVVLCFRPINAALPDSVSDAATLLHPTSNKSHPYQHNPNKGEDRLVVVTASGSVIEFHVMQGSLSAWSRRNPMSSFPQDFRILRDQAMGCVWDVSKSKERLWLYGSSWMWMFDLSQDFPPDILVQKSLMNGHVNGSTSDNILSQSNKRRKIRNSARAVPGEQRPATSGAGGIIPDSELITGISRKHQTTLLEGEGKLIENVIKHRRKLSEMDLDGLDGKPNDDDMDFTLKRLRRNEDVAMTNGDGQLATHRNSQDSNPLHSWHTYKYRPIMGIVPIYNGDASLEVVLVERPMWDMDLPPRYYGDQEREKAEL